MNDCTSFCTMGRDISKIGAQKLGCYSLCVKFYTYVKTFCLHCISVFQIHTWYWRKPEKGIGSPGNEVANDCKPSAMWELGIEPWSSERATRALSPEMPLCPLPFILDAFRKPDWCCLGVLRFKNSLAWPLS